MRRIRVLVKGLPLGSSIIAGGLASLAGCALCRNNDGLPPAQWEAREKAHAASALKPARQALSIAIDSAWTIERQRGVTEELPIMREEHFDLGGLYDFGGPLYAHSCIDATSDPPSFFLLHYTRAGLTPDSLVVISGKLTAFDAAKTRVPADRPSLDRRAISLRAVSDVAFRIYGDTGFVVFRCDANPALCRFELSVAAPDTNAGRAFVARLRAAARALRMSGSDAR